MTTRERIVDEALTLFAAKGFKGTTVRNIADAVGIKDASLYKHFRSKQEILDTIVKQMYEQIHNKFGVEYKPFDVPVNEDRSNIWGIVVVSENPCIHLDEI